MSDPEAVHEIPVDRAHDPREQEAWFLRLPPHAREAMRAAWRRREGTDVQFRERRRETTRRYISEAAIIFMVGPICAWVFMRGAFVGWAGAVRVLILSAIVGALTGGAAALVRAKSHSYAVIGLLGSIVATLVRGSSLFAVETILRTLIITCLCAAAGAMHLVQRFDTSEV